MEEKYTKDGLPIINKEIIETHIRDDIKYLKEDIGFEKTYNHIKEILNNENHILLRWLDHCRLTCPTYIQQGAFVAGFSECYKLLKRQAEVNKLEELSDNL